MRANLELINTKLRETLINLHVTDDEITEINKRLNAEPDRQAIDFTRRSIYRVFNNGSWEDGGRFYGGWWEGVPREYRPYIHIQNKPTAELDYSSIHPRILYAMEGKDAPEDAYSIPGWDRQHRDLIKKAFNQLLNSYKTTRSESQWRLLAPETDPEPLPTGWGGMAEFQKAPLRRQRFKELTGQDYDDLIANIIERHEPIKKHFFTRAWSWLQRRDSDIAEKVMMDLYQEDIVVLPVHDSFIVRRPWVGRLQKAMIEAFEEVVGATPKVDPKETEELGSIVETGDGIITGESMWKIVNTGDDQHRGYEKRYGEWIKVWGNLGWD
jgi:hypothetical protein